MRIAVVQHSFRSSADADADALLAAVSDAAAQGAEIIVVCEVPSVHSGRALDQWWQRVAIAVPDAGVLIPHVGPDPGSVAFGAELDRLGSVALLSGDAAIDPEILRETASRAPDIIVMGPRSESDLQSEAVLELAIELSLSAASLVIIAEPDGSPSGEPGHGGSALVYLGEVMAEAMSGDDTLLVDIDVPLSAPEPRGTLPRSAPILAQRLAAHQGLKVDVPYPADLS